MIKIPTYISPIFLMQRADFLDIDYLGDEEYAAYEYEGVRYYVRESDEAIFHEKDYAKIVEKHEREQREKEENENYDHGDYTFTPYIRGN